MQRFFFISVVKRSKPLFESYLMPKKLHTIIEPLKSEKTTKII